MDPDEERTVEILEISERVEVEQNERLASFKADRDGAAVGAALDAVRGAAQRNENVMPALIEGADAGCTLGEMVQALADIYGRYAGGPEW